MAERIFLGWEEHALPAAARLLADAGADPGGPSLAETAVVLPGTRAGRRLRELLLAEAERRGEPLPPPRTVTVGALPELLYEPERPLAGGLLERRAWAAALREAGPGLEAAFPEPPDEGDLTGWDALARVVARLHAEVGREGHSFSDVAELCGGDPALEEGGRWDALARAQEAYRRRLEEAGRADRQLARRRALAEGRVAAGEVAAVWLLGVVELPGLARGMLEESDVPVRALVHAPADRAGAFGPLGAVRPGAWAGAELDLPELTVCGRPPEQADAALAALSGGGEPLAPDEVTVGAPNREVVPHLAQRLEERGVPHRDAAGTPVEETRPYRLLEALADYLDGRRFRELAALVRHPDVARAVDVPLGAVDEYFEEHLPRSTDGLPLPGSPHSGAVGRLLEELRGTLGLGRLRGRRPLAEWVPAALGALEGVYGERELDAARPADRRLAEACSRVAGAAEEVEGLPARAAPECGPAAAIRILLAEAAERPAIPPEPERPAVELLGWLELHLDDAPVLVLTGMDDEAVTGAARTDPFLPDRLRSRLGLPDDRFRHGRDAYLLAAALRPREEAHLVVGRRSADGDPLRPSRLLLSASGGELAERVRRLFGEGERAGARRRPEETGPEASREEAGAGEEDSGSAPEAAPRFRAPPEPVIRVAEPPARLRVTDFRDLLEDPYRFALERIRGLEARGDRRRELEGLGFGGLAHDVLHRFAGEETAASPDADRVAARLLELLEEERRRRYGEDTFPAVRLQVEQLRQRLRDFARWQARRAAEGWRIAAAEASPEGGGVAFEVDGEAVQLRGRVDRIDRHEGRGEWQVLDYKTGESPKSPEKHHRRGRGGEERWVDLQLPLYRHLLAGIARLEGVPDALGRTREEARLGFVHLSGEGVELALAEWSREELLSADEAAREAVRRLRQGVFRYREGEGRRLRDDPLDPLFRSAAGRGGAATAGEDEA